MGEYADSLKKKKVVPAQATKALASETKKQANVEKKYKAPTTNKGEGAKEASKIAQALKKPQSESVEAARKQAAGIKASQELNENAYRQSLPYLNSSFKGVGYIPPKNNNTTQIPESGGPSSGTNDSSLNNETVVDQTPIMPPVPTPPSTSVETSAPISDDRVSRTPTRNVTDISSLVPELSPEEIQRILFENLSAIELSKIERHDTIEGIDQKYSIISNLSEIRKKYEVIKQLTIMDKFKPLTSIFTINIQDKIPQEDYILLENLDSTYQYLDESNQIVSREKGYYYIDTNGDLVIELINLEKNQQVEVQIDTNGTIYKVEL